MKTKMFPRAVRRFLRGSKAATTIEYAIVVGVVVVGAAAAVATFTDEIEDALETIADNISATTKNTGK